MQTETIHGVRVRLRPATMSDLPTLFRWRSCQDYVDLVSAERSEINQEEFTRQLKRVMGATNQVYFIIEKDTLGDQTPVGLVHIFNINRIHRHAFINLYADATFRKYGYGIEAGVWALCFLFDTLGMHKVYCDVLNGNLPSMSVVEHVGFVTEGTFKEHSFFNGSWNDVIRLAIFTDDKTCKLRKLHSRLTKKKGDASKAGQK